MSSHDNQLFKRGVRIMPLLLLVLLAACASNPTSKQPTAGGPSVDNRSADEQSSQTQRKQLNDDPSIDVSKLDQRSLRGIPKDSRRQFVDQDNPLSIRTIHFPFDSSTIPSKYRDVIQAHADYLAKHAKVDLRLEGHTDERGTREYNVALGANRAKSVAHALVIAGAAPEQITTLSFGEEMPAVVGHTPKAYAKNRRVELIYVDQ